MVDMENTQIMHNLHEEVFELVQNDSKISNISIDFQQMLSPLIQAKKYGAILQILKMIRSHEIGNGTLLFLESFCLLQEKNFKDSEILLLSAFTIDENENAGEHKNNFKALYKEIIRCKKIFDKLETLSIQKNAEEVADSEFIPSDLASNRETLLQRQKSIENQIPSILIVSTARAASSHISNQLCALSGSIRVNIESQPTPLEHDVALGLLFDFVRGGAVSYVHSRASPKNLKALFTSDTRKFVLHVRDPRQCFLSNYYRMHVSPSWKYKRMYYNHVPLEYEQMDFIQQIDWHIDNVYEHYWVNWIKEWVEVAESTSNDFHIKMMTKEIGCFFEQDWSVPLTRDLLIGEVDPKTEVAGSIDLWRHKLTTSQVKKLQELTPKYLLEKFKWER
jgi:hypothetical protein